jgi:hypothetical protein
MANQFQNVTAGMAQLKNYYQGPLRSQFNDEVPIYRGAEEGKHSWSGEQVIRPVKVRRNPGIGAASDGGSLPSIGRQTTAQAIITAKYNYLRFGITGPMIKASQSDVGSFVRSASYELSEGYTDLKNDCNRQLSWDGTGDLALLNAAAAASTSISVKGRESTEAALKFLDVGMVIDILNGSTVVASGVSIESITGAPNDSTATLVLSAAVTVSEDDIIIRSGSNGNEVQGLLTQLDGGTTTVFNIDRSNYISFQGNEIDRAGGQLTLDSMQNAYNESMRRGGPGLSAIYTDFDSLRMYQKLLTVDKRYVNSVKGDGGFASKEKTFLEFNGIPIVADKDCPTRFFFLPKKHIVKYVLCEMEFADETGSMYIAQSGVDALEVRVRHFFNLFNEKPSASSVLKGYISP